MESPIVVVARFGPNRLWSSDWLSSSSGELTRSNNVTSAYCFGLGRRRLTGLRERMPSKSCGIGWDIELLIMCVAQGLMLHSYRGMARLYYYLIQQLQPLPWDGSSILLFNPTTATPTVGWLDGSTRAARTHPPITRAQGLTEACSRDQHTEMRLLSGAD